MDPPVAPIALNVAPLNVPNRTLDSRALADLDYKISEEMLSRSRFHLQILNEIKIKTENIENEEAKNAIIDVTTFPKYQIGICKY